MVKWEYRVLVLDLAEITVSVLDNFGDDGWELVTCGRHHRLSNSQLLVFKRPVGNL
jgi:hypothetical protein